MLKRCRTNLFEQACKQIDNPSTRIVSFDVFDTLLARPVLEPADVFYFIASRAERAGLINDFVPARRSAEKMARKTMTMNDPLCEEPTLDGIYAALQQATRIGQQQCDALKALELAKERELMRARKPLKELYDYALRKGKKIIAVSDSYFSHEFIEQLLERNGFGDIETLYVSSQIGRTKTSGNLFPILLDDLKEEPRHIVHIGDNIKSDFKRPQALGIRCVHIPRGAYLFFTQTVCADIWADDELVLTPDDRMILGMVINERFDSLDPKHWRSDSLFNGDPELLGYYGLGPVYLAGAHNDPALLSAFAAELLQTSDPANECQSETSAFTRVKQGARQFKEDVEALFGTDLPDLVMCKENALAPLMQLLQAPFAADAQIFDGLSSPPAPPSAADNRPCRLPLHRRAELLALKPLLTPNLYLRLIHSSAEFFANTDHPVLKIYRRWRG